jgi:hypothetical protein
MLNDLSKNKSREYIMKLRIRYHKMGNKLTTVNPIFSKHGSSYTVHIDLENCTYLIRNQTSMRKYEGGEGVNNLTVLKRKVKKHLEYLGVEFDTEKRFRTFGLCEKGYTQEKHLQNSIQ